MPSDDRHWDVLPNPTIRELTPYAPPPTDHADPGEVLAADDKINARD